MKTKKLVLSWAFTMLCTCLLAQDYNPILPDFVADPSLSKFGDTYYLYGTTDIDQGLERMGPPVVWKSKDFVNWSFEDTLMTGIDWEKRYTYTDKEGKTKHGYFRYWAPGRVVEREGKYYLFPTLVSPDGTCPVYTMVADRPEGPFRFQNGDGIFFGEDTLQGKTQTIPLLPDIDAEPFIDDDGTTYMCWRRRFGSQVTPDFTAMTGEIFTFLTHRGGYSEGPVLFKRNNIYYYIYTLSGNQNYCNAYMMSKEGPASGYYTPPGNDIFLFSSVENGVWGPGHGNVFYDKNSDTHVFAYLEYGEGGTTRQVYVDRMNFNPDGSIQTLIPTRQGVGYLNNPVDPRINLAIGSKASASSFKSERSKEVKIETQPNNPLPEEGSVKEVSRTFTYLPPHAIDGSNGTRWEAAPEDKEPTFTIDLGTRKKVKTCEIAFTIPTFGHAWIVEKSTDGIRWKVCARQDTVVARSPHIVRNIGSARYLRVKILKGNPGIWEMKVF